MLLKGEALRLYSKWTTAFEGIGIVEWIIIKLNERGSGSQE